MEIRIENGQSLTYEHFESILALDIKAFGEAILTNKGMAEKRYFKFKDGIFAAYTGETLSGFISFYNVLPSVYERAVFQKEYIDDNLQADEIKPLTREAANYILLFDHVIDEEYQGLGISKLLVESVRDYLKQKDNQGYQIERIFGFAISKKGCRILSSLGGKAIWVREETTCLEMDKEIFLRLT